MIARYGMLQRIVGHFTLSGQISAPDTSLGSPSILTLAHANHCNAAMQSMSGNVQSISTMFDELITWSSIMTLDIANAYCSNRASPSKSSVSPAELTGVALSLRSEEHPSELQSLMRISYA